MGDHITRLDQMHSTLNRTDLAPISSSSPPHPKYELEKPLICSKNSDRIDTTAPKMLSYFNLRRQQIINIQFSGTK